MADPIIRTTYRIDQLDNVGRTVRSHPQTTYSVATTSGLGADNVQQVGVTEEVVETNDTTGIVSLTVENLHDIAIVEVGLVVSATFAPIASMAPGDPPVTLPRCNPADVFLKSDTADTPVRTMAFQIVEPI